MTLERFSCHIVSYCTTPNIVGNSNYKTQWSHGQLQVQEFLGHRDIWNYSLSVNKPFERRLRTGSV